MRGIASRVFVAAVVAISIVRAHEPDGRAALRYAWPEKTDDAPALVLTVTAVVPLEDARLTVTLPKGIGVALHGKGQPASAWPSDGIALGNLVAGQTVVVELDVAPPAKGGGVLGFALKATAEGREVQEGVGVTVGTPGVTPVERNGAIEYPAEQAGSTP